MTAARKTTPPAQPVDQEFELAKAALAGMLQDPNVNPRNQEALDTTVDFCWLIARAMLERRPPKRNLQ